MMERRSVLSMLAALFAFRRWRPVDPPDDRSLAEIVAATNDILLDLPYTLSDTNRTSVRVGLPTVSWRNPS